MVVFLFIHNRPRSCILTSGSPASDVKRLTIAAIAADEPTTAQLTSDSNAEVASTPQAVCAAVLIALMVAALSQIVQFVFMCFKSFFYFVDSVLIRLSTVFDPIHALNKVVMLSNTVFKRFQPEIRQLV